MITREFMVLFPLVYVAKVQSVRSNIFLCLFDLVSLVSSLFHSA